MVWRRQAAGRGCRVGPEVRRGRAPLSVCDTRQAGPDGNASALGGKIAIGRQPDAPRRRGVRRRIPLARLRFLASVNSCQVPCWCHRMR